MRSIDAYSYHVDRFAARYGKHSEELGTEQIRDFQLWMINELHSSWSQFGRPTSKSSSPCQSRWSRKTRRMYMEACRALAPVAPSSATADTRKRKEAEPTTGTPPRVKSCPHCQGSMQCIVKDPRPRWRELFYGPGHPAWYEWTSRGLCSPPDDMAEAGLPGEEVVDPGPDLFDEIIASRLE